MKTNQKFEAWSLLLLLSLNLLVSLSFQGSRGLYETTEGRYAESAREMVESGNYLEPTLAYRPHWTKPPMTYWAIAGGLKLIGMNEWGVRLYNSVAFIFTALTVTAIGTILWNRATGILSGLIYTTSFFTVLSSFAVSTDTLLALWEVSAVFCYLKAAHPKTKPGHRWIMGMWLFFGLGFLTKGPPALLPLLPIVFWHFRQPERPILVTPFSILLFFIVGFGWYLLVCYRYPNLLQYFLIPCQDHLLL